ncbi:MAG TPA: ABC transporter substrate-binding protein [Polyangiaceae bacterium]|nr:ABC transporter substrate-binding protein [Polyangiaceae bacterium]
MRSAARAVVIGVLLVASLGGCSKGQPGGSAGGESAAGTKLKLVLNWVPEPEFGGFYAARDGGAYRRQGFEVEVIGGGAGVPVVQMVATGRVHFGTIGADELLTARAHGADVVAVFATFQTSPQAIMVHASRNLTSLAEVFRSGTLAIEPGMAYAAYLKQKFRWENVQVVPYDGGVARFLADPSFAQQCYVTSEPIAAKKQGGDPQVFLVADAGYNPYTTVVVTRRELVEQKPEMVAAFVAATAEGWKNYLTDPRPTNQVLARLNPSMDAATLEAAVEAEKPLIATEQTKQLGLGSMSAERWATLARQLEELKLIDRAPPTTDLFVPVAARRP